MPCWRGLFNCPRSIKARRNVPPAVAVGERLTAQSAQRSQFLSDADIIDLVHKFAEEGMLPHEVAKQLCMVAAEEVGPPLRACARGAVAPAGRSGPPRCPRFRTHKGKGLLGPLCVRCESRV